ncbi:MAG TPA: 4Fe-4S dicluster domain-containing protein [Verrucomicrobiae bacterium]|nr:4Fe-4S dicluster domain-containing protein [Verrucomicrobiae bacterium]
MQPINLTSAYAAGKDLMEKVQKASGVDVKACYQCGKCSAGCPVAFAMDYTPRQVMRLLQLGLTEELLKSRTIWLCAQCETCSARCPRNLEPAKIMEALRIEAKKAGFEAEDEIATFNEKFLRSVASNGRLYEAGLVVAFNLATVQPFKDAGAAPTMLTKGKLKLFPSKIKGVDQVRRMFEKAEKMEGKE